MPPHDVPGASPPLKVKLRRGERMCLIAMDMDPKPGPDFAGFAIEVMSPPDPAKPDPQDDGTFSFLRNRLAFDYPAGTALTGSRDYSTADAPLQTFRWIHFPEHPKAGEYAYRVTVRNWAGGALVDGPSVTCKIVLCDETAPGFLDLGFTRNAASSQAFTEVFPDPTVRAAVLPTLQEQGLSFKKCVNDPDVYKWLGGKATQLFLDILDQAVADPSISLDMMAYDYNEPDVHAKLKTIAGLGGLRILIDDSGAAAKGADTGDDDGGVDGHAASTSAESVAARELAAAGAQVVRRHFHRLQHNKVVIVRKDGKAQSVLCGSMNFSFRGLYIQANNVLHIQQQAAVDAFQEMFELAFHADGRDAGAKALETSALGTTWTAASSPEGNLRLCFAPHPDNSELSLTPVAGAIDQASSSVFYAIAFLSMDKKGPVRQAIDRLNQKSLFSYGVVNRDGALSLKKPDGTDGLVDFEYLGAYAPEPFHSEWPAGAGINIHHKFVVTDFNLPTARLFTGSSNLATGGEENNGDHLLQITDPRVVTAYAIETLRMFDHLHFRAKMKEAGAEKGAPPPPPLRLQKPPGPGETAWFETFYTPNTQKLRDRVLFSS